MGRIIGWGVTLTFLFGLTYWLAGPVVSQALAANSGSAAGAGLKGTTTFASNMGDGWRAADTAQSQIDAMEAQERAKKAEKKAKAAEERARARQKKAEGQ
jgi:hypothetical protein